MDGQEWRSGGQKLGFIPQLIRHVCLNWNLQHLGATESLFYRISKEPQLDKCQLEHTHAGQKTGNVRPQLSSFWSLLVLLIMDAKSVLACIVDSIMARRWIISSRTNE
eukprot:1161227-Pelagomonas_calceolata.AAC.4